VCYLIEKKINPQFYFLSVQIDLLSNQQLTKGFNKVYSIMDDLVLDVPTAPVLVNEFVDRAKIDGILPADYSPAK
jgi:hypothetical protein